MCIVIDTNCLAHVFKQHSAKHSDFKDVLEWIIDGKGKFVYGGTTYLKELKSYLSILTELSRIRKSVLIDKGKVDDMEKWAAGEIQHPNFDDPHIVGLLIVSGCKLVCSEDERASDFFKHPHFFGPAAKRPKIYSGSRNRSLLTDDNIADVCKPAKTLTVKEKLTIQLLK